MTKRFRYRWMKIDKLIEKKIVDKRYMIRRDRDRKVGIE